MKNSKGLFWISAVLVVMAGACKKNDANSKASVTTAEASSITANSALSGGNITGDGGSQISQRGVCYAPHNNPTITDSLTNDGAGTGTYSSTLNNLNSYVTYYVRAYAINGSGTAYGNVDSFKTTQGLPTVTTTAISNIAPLRAQGGGNVLYDGGATVNFRGICWSTSPHPTTSNFKTSDSSGTGIFSDSLTSLASQTVYYVRAYATNGYGTAYGNEVSFTSSSANTVTDIDGNVYTYVMLCNQIWMAENLRVSHYQNGDPIVNALTTNFDWYTNWHSNLNVGAYTFPNLDSTNNIKYGKVYNNSAVNDSRGLCPAGWHVPSNSEWDAMTFCEGMTSADTSDRPYSPEFEGTIGAKLEEGGSSGLNLQIETGYFFTDTPGHSNGYTNFGPGGIGAFWTSTYFYAPSLVNWTYELGSTGGPTGSIYRYAASQYIVSVRCVKN